ncbi:hypothetical protein QTG56_22570 (plasmid) [Rossellomorea sp. AcN35-11]|nr:hypothetical protein [Rossellomorea aquimaris]WJV32158.1 hypothetical protein QTG56_22570 [Rossellomorea sp. AcN35-11]
MGNEITKERYILERMSEQLESHFYQKGNNEFSVSFIKGLKEQVEQWSLEHDEQKEVFDSTLS